LAAYSNSPEGTVGVVAAPPSGPEGRRFAAFPRLPELRQP
jgi:hypothetical protein